VSKTRTFRRVDELPLSFAAFRFPPHVENDLAAELDGHAAEALPDLRRVAMAYLVAKRHEILTGNDEGARDIRAVYKQGLTHVEKLGSHASKLADELAEVLRNPTKEERRLGRHIPQLTRRDDLTQFLYARDTPVGTVLKYARALAEASAAYVRAGTRKPNHPVDQVRRMLDVGVALALRRAGISVVSTLGTPFPNVLSSVREGLGIGELKAGNHVRKRAISTDRKWTWEKYEPWIRSMEDTHRWDLKRAGSTHEAHAQAASSSRTP
jgi:hypothetical protein